MIDFDFNKFCYGCGNCANVCPTGAISMVTNEEGFQMPRIDLEKCIQCGACDRQCVYLNVAENDADISEECYALYANENKQDEEMSSSAGVFPALARAILSEGGYVCGCVWDKGMVARHIVSNNWVDVQRMLHSKYTQSDMGNCYKEVKALLSAGKKVLFSGTPCQIAAVLKFTGNPENLFTCDLICKGVPSPGVWKKYVAYLERKEGAKLTDVVFRSKHRYGWTGPVTKYTFDNGKQKETLFFQLNHYIVGFLDGLYMRHSCYHCQYKNEEHKADLVLGDFWGINRKAFMASGNKGISAVIVRTAKGKDLFGKIIGQFQAEIVDYEQMVRQNNSMTHSTPKNENRSKFFAEYESKAIEKNITEKTDLKSLRKMIIRITYYTGIFKLIKMIKTKRYKKNA